MRRRGIRSKEISEWIHGYFRFFSSTAAQKSLAAPYFFLASVGKKGNGCSVLLKHANIKTAFVQFSIWFDHL